MKIAVVGCGAVGSYYGARLCHDGHDVHFLLRSDYEVVRRNGVKIESPLGNFTAHPSPANSPDQIGPSDLVIVALKTTANASLEELVAPLVDDESCVLTLQNGLGTCEDLLGFARADQIVGGLCFVCLNRIAPGVVRHLDHGLIVIGEFAGEPRARTSQLAETLKSAGIPCKIASNLRRAQWEKLVWNVPFNGLGVASVAGIEPLLNLKAPMAPSGSVMPTDALLADEQWTRLLRELMIEIIRTANALGFAIPETLADEQIERTRTMGAYKASTLLDFESGNPLELESIFLRPLREAERVGVSTPRLKAVCRVLKELASRA